MKLKPQCFDILILMTKHWIKMMKIETSLETISLCFPSKCWPVIHDQVSLLEQCTQMKFLYSQAHSLS